MRSVFAAHGERLASGLAQPGFDVLRARPDFEHTGPQFIRRHTESRAPEMYFPFIGQTDTRQVFRDSFDFVHKHDALPLNVYAGFAQDIIAHLG